MADPSPPQPRPAATVLLLRDVDGGLEVLLQRRAQGMGFMAGAYVFPGGRVDDADREAATLGLCDLPAQAAAVRLGLLDSPDFALAVHVAALREVFEEAGLMLAIDRSNQPVDSADALFENLRAGLRTKELGFLEFLQRAEVRLCASSLQYFARWVTPELESRRFDARFFLATVPATAKPTHDDAEAVESVWVRPADAVQLGRDGKMLLPPPTTKSLELLSDFETTAAAMKWAAEREPVTVCPEAELDEDGRVVILLPGDARSSVRVAAYPGPTRYLLSDDAWRPG